MDRVFVWKHAKDLDLPANYVGVTIERLPDGGWHTGVLYCTRQQGPHVLHLMGHYGGDAWKRFRYLHENPHAAQLCVLCPLDEVEIPAMRRAFLGLYRANNDGLPYGFSPPVGEWFEANYKLAPMPPGKGLCCQTFVLAAYKAARFPLIDPAEAPMRPDDQERQRTIYEKISERLRDTSPRTQEHFAVVEATLGMALYRPLEVAGAAKADVLPCPFAEAQANGNELESLVPPPQSNTLPLEQ